MRVLDRGQEAVMTRQGCLAGVVFVALVSVLLGATLLVPGAALAQGKPRVAFI
jgi:hypothetical protein